MFKKKYRKLFLELNPARDEWADPHGLGIYGPRGWCLIGLYIIWPNMFAFILFNLAIGFFQDENYGD